MQDTAMQVPVWREPVAGKGFRAVGRSGEVPDGAR